jgi:hypothetical protein
MRGLRGALKRSAAWHLVPDRIAEPRYSRCRGLKVTFLLDSVQMNLL